MRNLATLLRDAAARRPDAQYGELSHQVGLGRAVAAAGTLAAELLDSGLDPARPCALIGPTSTPWLISWMALQLAGVPVALINPLFPDDLVDATVAPLEPAQILLCGSAYAGRYPARDVRPDAERHLDGASGDPAVSHLPGLARHVDDVSGYMHTSGTTGAPKLVVQSHEYFVALGRYFADLLCITDRDRVFAPLPVFHINPLGYGVLGALTGRADCVLASRFSASAFWSTARDERFTIAVLHAPQIEILRRRTTGDDARGHELRAVFYANVDFLQQFDIPLGVSGYGSTEGGGISHTFLWRPGDDALPPEGAQNYGGFPRGGFSHTLGADGEILIGSTRRAHLARGYVRPEAIEDSAPDGWYHTGDLGRVDDAGGLVYVSRLSESVRVKGEFVPLNFVENHFRSVPGVADVAVWKRASALVDDDLVLYVEAEDLLLDAFRSASADLPPYMRPAAIARVTAMPRDTGVGKVRRRELDPSIAAEVVEL